MVMACCLKRESIESQERWVVRKEGDCWPLRMDLVRRYTSIPLRGELVDGADL